MLLVPYLFPPPPVFLGQINPVYVHSYPLPLINIHTYMHVHVHALTHIIYMYVHVHALTHIHIQCTCTCTHSHSTCTCTHSFTYTYFHVCAFIISLSLSLSLFLPPSLSTPLPPQKDEVYLNLVLDFVPDTVYRVIRHHSKARQTMPILYVKVRTSPNNGPYRVYTNHACKKKFNGLQASEVARCS